MSDPDIEKGAALAAALKQLFEQYPTGIESRLDWRERAIAFARVGILDRAFLWAKDTGIPDEVLDALRGLLDG